MRPETERRPRHKGGAPDNDSSSSMVLIDADKLQQAAILTGTQAERELAAERRGFRRGYRRGRAEGRDEGYLASVAEAKAAEHGLYDLIAGLAAIERRRWHLCCRRCRLNGHRTGCQRCEDRARATFGQPHPDDFPGRSDAA